MKILVDVVNSDKVKDLTTEIQKQKDAISYWNKEMASANAVQKNYLQSSMEQAAHAIARANEQIKQIPISASSAGRGLGQLAYAIDDIQYGFNAIVNNIPQIVMGLGASAGIAGAAGIAAVAINQLWKHWGELSDLISANWSSKSIEQLKQIRENAEAAKEALDKVPGFTKQQGKQAEGVGDIIQAGPKDKIIRELMDAIQGNPALRVQAFPPMQIPGVAKTEEQQKNDMLAEQQRALKQKAEAILGRALIEGKQGDPARELLGHLLPGRAAELRALSPAGQKEAADAQKREERLGREHQVDMEARKEQEKMFQVEKDAADKIQKDAERKGDQDRKAAHEMGDIKKKDEDAIRKKIHERIAAEKTARMQGLEDQREALHKEQRAFDEQMWEKQRIAHTHGQHGEGAKAFIDYYKGSAAGDDPKALAKQAHDQRVKMTDKLQAIEDLMKKERRLVVPN